MIPVLIIRVRINVISTLPMDINQILYPSAFPNDFFNYLIVIICSSPFLYFEQGGEAVSRTIDRLREKPACGKNTGRRRKPLPLFLAKKRRQPLGADKKEVPPRFL